MTTTTENGTTAGKSKRSRTLAETATDLMEKASGPALRTGLSAQRVKAMVASGIDPRVAKTQLDVSSERLGNNHTYSLGFITELCNFVEDCEVGTSVSKATATALIKDQKVVNQQEKGSMDA